MRSKAAVIGLLALAALAGCNSYDSPIGPGGGGGGVGGGGGGGGGGGASSAQIVVGNILFRSSRNASQNPAVDTVAAGATVTWTWTGTGSVRHNVQSEASPSFASSAIQSGDGTTYSVRFDTPGTYQYDCAVHGAAMRGTIVVR